MRGFIGMSGWCLWLIFAEQVKVSYPHTSDGRYQHRHSGVIACTTVQDVIYLLIHQHRYRATR